MKYSVVLCIAACTVFSSNLSARIWTSSDGRTVEAQIVTADATTVTIRLLNKTTAVLNLEALSAVDEVYVKDWIKANPGKAGKSAPVKPAPVTPATTKPPTTPTDPAPPATPVTTPPTTVA